MGGNIGRPKIEGLDRMLRIAIDDKDATTLKNTAKKMNTTKSEIVRKLLKSISSKDFEQALPQVSLELLEDASIACWDSLHQENCIFDTNGLSDIMPAFITKWSPPSVYVKFPTFRIQVFGKTGDNSENKTVDEIAHEVSKNISIYETKISNIVIGDTDLEEKFTLEIMCLEDSLSKNIISKDRICAELKSRGYSLTVYAAYCIKGARIEFLLEEKYFRVIK